MRGSGVVQVMRGSGVMQVMRESGVVQVQNVDGQGNGQRRQRHCNRQVDSYSRTRLRYVIHPLMRRFLLYENEAVGQAVGHTRPTHLSK